MNYFEALQRSETKRWHYTCRNGRNVWAVGKCGEDGGHATPEEARICYREFLIANADLNVKVAPGGTCGAEGCEQKTEKAALVANAYYRLCKDHMNAKTLDEIVPAVGTIISS